MRIRLLELVFWIMLGGFIVAEAVSMMDGDVSDAVMAATLASLAVLGIGISRWLR